MEYVDYQPPSTWNKDFRVLQAMWFARIKGDNLQEKLDSFYKDQADLYDSYRYRMLHGRPKMLRNMVDTLTNLPQFSARKGELVWVDLGGGTGANLENLSPALKNGCFRKVVVVDLCLSLLNVAMRDRGSKWPDVVETVHGDATDPNLKGLPKPGTCDVVTISYALSMIPNWRECIANAKRLLRPGGIICVCDFTCAPDQYTVSAKFWETTFAADHVHLSSEHYKHLQEQFHTLYLDFSYGTFPYIPFFLKSAYYVFVGSRGSEDTSNPSSLTSVPI